MEHSLPQPKLHSMPLESAHVWWGVGMLLSGALSWIHVESLRHMIHTWLVDDNYGHGLFVPFITMTLIWMHRHHLSHTPVTRQWWGLILLVLAALLFTIGTLSALFLFQLLSWWVSLVALTIAFLGIDRFRVILFPMMFLLTMIPLPQFLSQGMANQLQLIASSLGVGCLQVMGITAFQEGNVIDLGPIQLQVIEACSGLRYLIPLITLALLFAYLFSRAWWKRAVIVLSSIPIAILLNGVRIGLVGLLVEVSGPAAADGLSHFVEGWMLFVASVGLLTLIVWSLGAVNPLCDTIKVGTRSGVIIQTPESNAKLKTVPVAAFAIAVLGLGIGLSPLHARVESPPERQAFTEFPLQINGWTGTPFPLEKAYLDSLQLDDYLLADFQRTTSPPVTVYSAYYHSQKSGQSTHSPATCIPGGGWEIISHTVHIVRGENHSVRMPVNRVVIQKNSQQQIVYYWFKQRHRHVTSEYWVKGWLLWDALLSNRTDGALIRLSSAIAAQESEQQVDRRLEQFTEEIEPLLTTFVPS